MFYSSTPKDSGCIEGKNSLLAHEYAYLSSIGDLNLLAAHKKADVIYEWPLIENNKIVFPKCCLCSDVATR